MNAESIVLKKWRNAVLKASKLENAYYETRWYQLLERIHLQREWRKQLRISRQMSSILKEAGVF